MAKQIVRILRKPEVLDMVGVSDATLWRWERDGKFPKRIQLGSNSCGWIEGEILDWVQDRAAEREVV